MSRLRELRLHGFKSFADQTLFTFDPGVNAVIGPNGSGKSNMADAVRWVLGEQSNRSLRTRRADDVIFGGSDARKAQGMAEVILTLDNGDGWLPIDFAEVSIGRRAYRSGESEYLINGSRARLRDIVELLGGGGLGANERVVVGQGTVDAALSLRPEERRQLFEEAAGVKGLQVKRNEAAVRLARTGNNLTRVNDLIAELRPQVRRLALQAEHQQQHDSLGARARALVIAAHRRREQAARTALGDARRTAAAAAAALEADRALRETNRLAIAAAEERYWQAEEEARVANLARGEAREAMVRLDARLEAIGSRERELSAALSRDEHELAETEAMLSEPDEDSIGWDVEAALGAAAAAESAWQEAVEALARADDALESAERDVAEARATNTDAIAARARTDEERARHQVRHEHAAAERAAAEAGLAEQRAVLATLVAERERAERALEAAFARLEDVAAERDAAQHAADEARGAVVELGEKLQAMRAEVAALAEPHDGATRLGRRLAAAGWPLLLDAVRAPPTSWAAIEAVVGGEPDDALLWTGGDPSDQMADARGAARLLATASASDKVGRSAALAAVGGDRTLAEWIGLDSAPVAFARTAVAADLPALLSGWRALPTGWGAVTPEGDLADARGLVIRGRADPPGGASARAHARRLELTSAVDELERHHAAAQREAHATATALIESRAAHLAVRDEHDAAERAARVAREAETSAEAAVRRATERTERLAADLEALQAETPDGGAGMLSDAAAEPLDRRQRVADAARASRDALAARRDEARESWTTARRAASEIETRTASWRGERAAREARGAQLQAAILDRRTELTRLAEERRLSADELGASREVSQRADAANRRADEARSGRREDLISLERQPGMVDPQTASQLEMEARTAAIEVSRLVEALAGLDRERELALEGLPPAGDAVVPAEAIEALDDEALDVELRRVRRTLSQIGAVNPFALDEHRELSGRLNEMSEQDADLRAAVASTQELIATLDAEIAAQFDAAFRAIGVQFDEYCRLLFAGGSASLQISDPADGDAPGGIEIAVRPPGKRLQRLAMLSGGERALTGVALLFAMLTVNPVPFCILDEVDAALDEANIGRFADALRKLSDSIDFVVITHNRATIEVADTIYGVTMTDAAVSRVISLRLADVPLAAAAT